MKFKALTFCLLLFLSMPFFSLQAEETGDSDKDGLPDGQEMEIYRTNPYLADTDQDGYSDGDEVKFLFDPNRASDDRLQKTIRVSLKDQTLSYSLGPYKIQTIKISSGLKKTPTPKGEFSVLVKKPLVTYKGAGYFYPNTRWNMMFKRGSWGNLYIHGAYWHDKFGKPASHGCVNVSYADMEGLYNWADTGTKVTIE